ncbi:hypothetical protein [Neorhodopirellula lusitana]|uniref:hypothetical protein n=1 Tax=Neorhodopirellula lusitana TaxID=445327 RepID=UPI00384C29D6
MKILLSAVVAVMALATTAQAQWVVPHTTTHYHNVPHTTTHTDYVQHGNHVDAVPHTTTHIDRVPHTTTHYDNVSPYGNQPIYNQRYRSSRPVIQGQVIQGQTYPQQGRVIYRNGVRQNSYVQPYQSYRPSYQSNGHLHTQTHTDYVPHTQTHIDYQRHGNHLHAVPHTTTHIDAVPHTTTNIHYGHH